MKPKRLSAGIMVLIVSALLFLALTGPGKTIPLGGLEKEIVPIAATQPGHSDGTAPNHECPYASVRYADGCGKASGGPPPHPGLLMNYKVRPPWDVAGVDYAVGVPTGTALRSWTTIKGNPSFEIINHQIRCVAGAASLDTIDFSDHGGGYVYVPKGGCTSLTITNSRWACSHTVWPSYWLVQDQNAASVSITYSSFNGTDCGGDTYAWVTGSDITFEYNYSAFAPAQIIQARAPGRVMYRYNVIYDNATVMPDHSNDQEWDGTGTIASDDIEFNTVFQQRPACNETFQFYDNNNVGSVIRDPILRYNTIIARPASVTNNCGARNPDVIMSFLIHGTSDGYPTVVTGTAKNEFNYFDARGAYAAYYPGSMKGWSSRGNTDMNTGRPITPQ